MGLKSGWNAFCIACKAFFKAFKDPRNGALFVEGQVDQKNALPGDYSHLRLLSYLQQSGRWIDFLKEDLSSFNDAQIGAAVRKIHQDCGQSIEELVTIRPLRDENEGATVRIPVGYDPAEIKIVGKVKGEPPFTGILIHRGWKAHKLSLPKQTGSFSPEVICPAEIEIK